MKSIEILSGHSFLPHKDPKKLIFMLHGYGDVADNFINISTTINLNEWKANFFALDAPHTVPNYPSGRQWFDLYPNKIYIGDAGIEELKIVRSEIENSVKKILHTINVKRNQYKLNFLDCFVIGFSQGGMMTFELGNFSQNQLGGLAIISGRIIQEDKIQNNNFLKTPLFISHGNQDEVLSVKNFHKSCKFLKNNHFKYEGHLLENDNHTISLEAIDLLQNFIKKNL